MDKWLRARTFVSVHHKKSQCFVKFIVTSSKLCIQTINQVLKKKKLKLHEQMLFIHIYVFIYKGTRKTAVYV